MRDPFSGGFDRKSSPETLTVVKFALSQIALNQVNVLLASCTSAAKGSVRGFLCQVFSNTVLRQQELR